MEDIKYEENHNNVTCSMFFIQHKRTFGAGAAPAER